MCVCVCVCARVFVVWTVWTRVDHLRPCVCAHAFCVLLHESGLTGSGAPRVYVHAQRCGDRVPHAGRARDAAVMAPRPRPRTFALVCLCVPCEWVSCTLSIVYLCNAPRPARRPQHPHNDEEHTCAPGAPSGLRAAVAQQRADAHEHPERRRGAHPHHARARPAAAAVCAPGEAQRARPQQQPHVRAPIVPRQARRSPPRTTLP
jgi:hypothetical protein